MNSVLVTGGAGFIGSNFCHLLQAEYPSARVVVFDKLTYAASASNLLGTSSVFVQGDVCDWSHLRDVIDGYSIDTVVHFAAETHVDRSIARPAPFVQSNIVGTANVLDAIRASKSQPRLHYISTDEVYGDIPEGSMAKEGDPYAPSSPYAASKASGDHLVLSYVRTYGLAATISHSTNNYGPRQNAEKLLPLAIKRMLNNADIPVYGDGLQERDWIFVDDHNLGILKILDQGVLGEVYNISFGSPQTNLYMLQTLQGIVGSSSNFVTVTDRPGHDRRYALDNSKLTALGWSPQTDLPTGLAQTVAWYRNNGA